MLLLGRVRVALISLFAAFNVISPHGSGVLARPAEESASATSSTGTDASSMALTTSSSSLAPSSSSLSTDGTSASSTTSQTTTTTSGDTSSKTAESTSSPMSSSTTSSDGPQSTTPTTTTTNGTSTPDDQKPPPCTNPTGPFAPICEPNDGKEVWVGDTYIVRWDPSYHSLNSTIILRLNYADPLPNEGKQAWQSPETRNGYGSLAITMDKAWLRDQARNNLTLWIVQMDPTPDAHASEKRGPTISLTQKPVTHPTPRPQPHTSRLGLWIGLPVALAVVALVLCGLFLGKRKTRQLGVGGSVMGRRRGYGVKQSRRQRVRGAADEDVDEAARADGGFRDEPTRGGVELDERTPAGLPVNRAARVEGLGSLAGDDRYTDDDDAAAWGEAGAGAGARVGAGNAFREEVQRQQRGRGL
ncbi:MAG: hypothetical protein M1816_001467 [Peltula sp. TS41687]|nr:MAG: hypothetical protein M1816_001467 [Peltula sp. TS41687]